MNPPTPAAIVPSVHPDDGPAVFLASLRYLLTGAALWIALQYSDDPTCLVINACLLLLPWFLLSALTGRWEASLGFAALLAILVYAMGEMKYSHLGDRLAAGDFREILRPANWEIVRQYPLLQTGLALAGCTVLLLLLDAWLQARLTPRMGVAGRIAALCAAVGLAAFCYQNRHQHHWEVFRDDADCGDMHICGVFTRLVYSTGVFEFEPPDPADPGLFISSMGDGEADAAPRASGPLPDIVVWLNESTFDPRQFQLPGAKLPRLRMFETGPRTVASGALRVHTFGGKTWLSEFSVLTGLVPEDFGAGRSLVFETVPPRITSNLVRLLKSQGYHTLALMPTPKRFYGAADTYAALGVDQVLTLRDLHEYDAVRGDEWDLADSPRLAEAALALIHRFHEAAVPSQPLFLYMLSIKEHAPYSKVAHLEFKLDQAGISQTLARRLSDYIGRLRTLDTAISTLEGTLARAPRPTLFCWFGDHQPYFEEDPPQYRGTLPFPSMITQYQITANFPARRQTTGAITDIAFLPSLLVDLSHVRRDRLFAAMSNMRRLCAGRLADCPNGELVDSYRGYVYGPQVSLLRQE